MQIHSAGSVVKVELLSEEGDRLNADDPHGRFRDAPFEVGDWVYVSMQDARIFTEDYVI